MQSQHWLRQLQTGSHQILQWINRANSDFPHGLWIALSTNFSQPDQTDGFGRKLAVCVLNAFICDFKYVELIIESKPPEWSNDGGVYLAQHLILLKVNHRKHQLFGTEILWPCTKVSLKKQIRHWRSRMIARNLDCEIYSSSNYNIIVKDNIQKIISVTDFPKVSLLLQTQFTYLIDKYKKEYAIEK